MKPVAFGFIALALCAPSAVRAANPIQTENSRFGTPGWAKLWPTSEIEAYADQVSVAPGEELGLHVAGAPEAATRYRIDVYRLGWYSGAGARLVACIPACWADRPTSPRPATPATDWETGEVRADWPRTDSLPIPLEWVSGYYEARVLVTAGPAAGTAHPVYFVVRSDLSGSAVLVQVPVNTWQAYNNWGGKSLYGFNSTAGARANRVSFDRPYELAPMAGAQGTPLAWEIQLVRFLEREGHDVAYQTDADTDREAGSLLEHRLVVTAGHGEYWTMRMRDAFDRARDLGTNLLFAGANNAYWHVRYERERRTMVGYKSWADPIGDPGLKTVLFRDLGRPECALVGVMHLDTMGLTDYAVNPAALDDPWFSGTGFDASSTLPFLVGLECDAMPTVPPAGCAHPGLTVFFRHEGPPGAAHAVRHVAASGARVFASGTMQFSWALDDFGATEHTFRPPDARVQRFVRNALADLLRPAPPASLDAVARVGAVELTAAVRADPRVREVVIARREGGDRFDPSGDSVVVVCRSDSCSDRDLPGHRTYRYAAFVRDEWSHSEPTFSMPVEVTNTPPSVRLGGPARATTGTRVVFRAFGDDRDGDPLAYTWRVDGRVRPSWGAALVVRFTRAGKRRISVTIQDGHGGAALARHAVRVRGKRA